MIKRFPNKEEIHKILLKCSNQAELTEEEKNKLDKWVNSDEERIKQFQTLNALIDVRKLLLTATTTEMDSLLETLRTNYPDIYSEAQKGFHPVMVKMSIMIQLDEQGKNIVHQIVYGRRAIRIVAVIVRLIALLIVIFIIISSIIIYLRRPM